MNAVNFSLDFMSKNIGKVSKLKCRQISKEMTILYLDYLKNTIKVSDATIKTRLTGLQTIFNFYIEQGYMKKIKVLIPKYKRKMKETYTDEEIDKLIEFPAEIDNTDFNSYIEHFELFRTWVMILTFLGTGTRLGACRFLKVSDYNAKNKSLFFADTKTGEQVELPISNTFSEVLTAYLKVRKNFEGVYLFCTRKGGMLAETSVENIIFKYNKKRGVNKRSCHLFRHRFAKDFILNNGSIKKLQELLMHRTLEMSSYYSSVYPMQLREDLTLCNSYDLALARKCKANSIL